MEQTKGTFNPKEHLMRMPKGGKEYLPAAARIAWFREQYPIEDGWRIEAKLIEGGIKEGYAVYRAEITDPDGVVVQTGTKQESKADFGDYMEKAETGSIARAVAMCGFGILQAQEFDEGDRIVDTPQPARGGQRPAAPKSETPRPAATTTPEDGEAPPTEDTTPETTAASAGDNKCVVCGAEPGSTPALKPARVNWCRGKALPVHCSTCSLPEAN